MDDPAQRAGALAVDDPHARRPGSCAARTYSSTTSAHSLRLERVEIELAVGPSVIGSSAHQPGQCGGRHERDRSARAAPAGTRASRIAGDLVGAVQLREVHQHDVLVLEPVGALDQLVEVDVAAGARGLERLALVEERALDDQHARASSSSGAWSSTETSVSVA